MAPADAAIVPGAAKGLSEEKRSVNARGRQPEATRPQAGRRDGAADRPRAGDAERKRRQTRSGAVLRRPSISGGSRQGPGGDRPGEAQPLRGGRRKTRHGASISDGQSGRGPLPKGSEVPAGPRSPGGRGPGDAEVRLPEAEGLTGAPVPERSGRSVGGRQSVYGSAPWRGRTRGDGRRQTWSEAIRSPTAVDLRRVPSGSRRRSPR